MKYVATLKVYFEGPDETFAVNEQRLTESEALVLDMVGDFMVLLKVVAQNAIETLVPTTARIMVDKEQGDGQVT